MSPSYSLSRFLCACCRSPDGAGAGRGECPTRWAGGTCSRAGASAWGFAGSCFWVWSVHFPCFKGSGCELASEASPPLIKNFFLFLNHHVFISHWNKVSF